LQQVRSIYQDPELTQKEKLNGAIILTRIEYMFTLLILIPFVVSFEWIWDELKPTIGKAATNPVPKPAFLR
jgi:hypothetical protein